MSLMLALLLGALFAAAQAQAQSAPTNVLSHDGIDPTSLVVTAGDEKLDLTWAFLGWSNWPLGSVQAANRHCLDHQHQHPYGYRRQPQHNRSYGRHPVRRPNLCHSLRRWHSVPGQFHHRQRHSDGDERHPERHRHPGLRVHGQRHVGAAQVVPQSHAGAGHGAVCGLQPCELRWRAARRRAQMERAPVYPRPERQKASNPRAARRLASCGGISPVSPASSGGSGTSTRSRQAATGSLTTAGTEAVRSLNLTLSLSRTRAAARPPVVAVLLPVAEEAVGAVPPAQSSDASLDTLEVEEDSLDLDPDTDTYAVNAYGETSLTLTPTANHPDAEITVDGETVESGADISIDLEDDGETVIRIVVTAEDGTTRTYTLTVMSCPGEERKILEMFYDSTQGDVWEQSGGWNTEDDLRDWHGVDTDEDGNVRSLRLPDNGLSGDTPSALKCFSELSGLSELALWDNDELSGKVPDELVPAVERAVLRDVAEALELNTEWFEDYEEPFDFEDWHSGVTTDDEGRVTELDFTGEDITGEIPGSVFELESLMRIETGCEVTLEVEAPGRVSVVPDDCPEETAPEDMEERGDGSVRRRGLRGGSRGFFCARFRLVPRDSSCLCGACEKKGADRYFPACLEINGKNFSACAPGVFYLRVFPNRV